MASFSQSSFICSLHTTKTLRFSTFPPTNPRISTFKTLKISASSSGRCDDDESSPPNSSDTPENFKPDRVKLAFESARGYKKSLQLNEIREIGWKHFQNQFSLPKYNHALILDEYGDLVSGDGDSGQEEVPEAVRIAMEKSKEYQENKGKVGNEKSSMESELFQDGDDGQKEVLEAVRNEMEKTEQYGKSQTKVTDSNDKSEQLPGDVGGGEKDVPEAVRIAMEKAKEYKKNKGTMGNNGSIVESLKLTGSPSKLGNENIGRKEELKISSIDFIGLDFADKKKSRGLPAGLVPVVDSFPGNSVPEVEFLVGDASKFENTASSESKTISEVENSDLYKPKVTTWGMFPRPRNISKTFGGGRTIRPGEALETPEDRAAKEARTTQLISAYKSKIGLNMDPKLKAECEKALKDGDLLMDAGRLKEALPYYQNVMDKLAFQTQLHGLAALQWSICQDSLNSPEKARVMYEKLQSHPNVQVNKKARQFMFSFRAMEMMKVTRSTVSRRNAGYEKYFEAFVEDKENYTSGSTEAEETSLNQALPYIIFLAAPILLVLLLAASKGI